MKARNARALRTEYNVNHSSEQTCEEQKMDVNNQRTMDVKTQEFLKRTVIVVAAVAGILYFTDYLIENRIQSIRESTHLGGREFWTRVEKTLSDLADPKSEMPPAKKAKILSDIKIVSERWRPFVEAVLPAGLAKENGK
jgi:hypothetical protein